MENFLIVLVMKLLFLSSAVIGTDTSQVKKAKDIQQNMYAVLRTMALPEASNDIDSEVNQRFVLQVPGKILNPTDYDPTNYTKDPLSSFIPPIIEENMFRLTDIVPVAEPMKGGETGESFVDMYEATLNQLDVRGFEKKTAEDKQSYQEAIDYLAKSLVDPDDLTKNVTRLGLYARLQKKYDDIRLDMEDQIQKARDEHTDDPVKYQTWFQTHYPALYANVENAYTEWLVFGEKDLVELYKSFLDVESQGVAVEEARMALRSSGKISLDRASTVYPVHFEPSNWYEYLRPRPQSLSREQIQLKIGEIEARLAVLEAMINHKQTKNESDFIQTLEGERDSAKTDLDTVTSSYNEKKLTCMKATEDKESKDETACQNFRDTQSQLTKLSTKYATKKAETEFAKFQLGGMDESNDSIRKLMTGLQAEKKRYTLLLENAPAVEPASLPKIKTKEDAQDFEAGWMEFEFDSSTSSKTVDSSSKSYAASVSFSAGGFLWSVSGGASYSRAEQDFAQKMSQADLKISAKILKVSIKRPWFKSSLFKFNNIMTRANQKVSPGPMTEPEFIKTVQKDDFLMPQFVNAFLLAKDVQMEFRGVDSSVKQHALQESASAHLSGHYGPYSASASFSYGHTESHLNVHSTADGIRISIPGAQVIGYYVTVLPCFPKNTC